MLRPTFANEWYGTLSVLLGGLTLLVCFVAFTFQAGVLLYAVPVISLVGIVLGVLGVKTKLGAGGLVLNLLPIIFWISLFYSLKNFTLHSM